MGQLPHRRLRNGQALACVILLLAAPAAASDWIDCCKSGGHTNLTLEAVLPSEPRTPPTVVGLYIRSPSEAIGNFYLGVCHSRNIAYIRSILGPSLVDTHELELWGPPRECGTWWHGIGAGPLDPPGTVVYAEYQLLAYGLVQFEMAGAVRESLFVAEPTRITPAFWGRIKALYR